MSDLVPQELISSIREGRAALLLGAGASYGSEDAAGRRIPLGDGMAAKLVRKFLGPDYDGLGFREAYDFSCSQRDVRTVQEFIADELQAFVPADYHLLIPTFSWSGIFTTNYDLIIESAYKLVGKEAIQKIIPHTKDVDGATEKLDDKSVLYTKLHGCITRAKEVRPPMIASTEQLISFGEGRKGQFDIFMEASRTKNIVFVGYSFNDSNLRQLIDVIVREGDTRPRHFIVDPKILPAASTYWRERRFEAIKTDFSSFLTEIDQKINHNARRLSSLSLAISSASSFSPFINVAGREESDDLKQYIKFGLDHVTPRLDVLEDDRKKFFKGFNLGWLPYKKNLDIQRRVNDDILSDHVITEPRTNSQSLIILKGHAGAGKSVSLRRICWEASTTYERLCFFMTRATLIRTDLFEEIFSLTKIPVFVFIDGVASHRNKILELLAVAKSNKATLKIFGTETFNTWNTSCDDLERSVSAEYEMRPLSDKEAESLVKKLDEYDSLGELKKVQPSKRAAEFMESYGRQLLVALLEVTHGVPLVEIINEEYQSIKQDDARQLYLDICSLHRFGPPVRAGLISRIHSIDFEEFNARFFKPLEQIVHLRKEKTGDYVYEARHPHIASALYDVVLKNQNERYANLQRLVTKLNPSYSYDLEALSKILRADNIHRILNDKDRGRAIYELALDHVGELAFLLHQRGVFEIRAAEDMQDLNRASSFLEKAAQKETWNKSIKHSMAELDLRRSRMSRGELERQTWRQSAITRASELTLGDTSPYPYHTIIKAWVDEISDALAAVEGGETESNVKHLGECVESAEQTLKRAKNKFPGDETLLSSEGELASVLSNASRAEGAFRRAFAKNSKSTLIAKRLVRILRAKGSERECIEILKKTLEFNQSAADIHYDLARAYLREQPDGYSINSDAILYHLRRSFVSGDDNYDAQFWYARQLAIMGRPDEARPIFSHLNDAPVPFTAKMKTQGVVKLADGSNKTFVGTVTRFRSAYGYAVCEDLSLNVFLPERELSVPGKRSFIEGSKIDFELGFNFKGAVGLRLHHKDIQ